MISDNVGMHETFITKATEERQAIFRITNHHDNFAVILCTLY